MTPTWLLLELCKNSIMNFHSFFEGDKHQATIANVLPVIGTEKVTPTWLFSQLCENSIMVFHSFFEGDTNLANSTARLCALNTPESGPRRP